jgi:type IV pilus assembly protein PilW
MKRSMTNAYGRRAQRGVTLIELMVGLTLGMIVSAGLLSVFSSAVSQAQNLGRASAQIENGRYVVELLQDELRMAGFVGEISTRSVAHSNPDPCATAPADAFAYNAAAANTTTVPAAVQGIGSADVLGCLSHRLAGTAAVVLRRVSTSTTAAASLAAGNAQYAVQYSFCKTDPITPLVYGIDKTAFTLHDKTCTGLAPLRNYVSQVYYIADCNDCSGSGDGVPTLKRVELNAGTLVETALADGVENLQLEYGFDTNADGNVDEYRTALGASGAVASWGNVMAVRVHIITRSTDKASGSALAAAQRFTFGQLPATIATANDGYIRRSYSTAVRLMNPAGARETQ